MALETPFGVVLSRAEYNQMNRKYVELLDTHNRTVNNYMDFVRDQMKREQRALTSEVAASKDIANVKYLYSIVHDAWMLLHRIMLEANLPHESELYTAVQGFLVRYP